MVDDRPRHDEPRGHESRDLSIRAIAVFFVGLTLLIVVAAVAMKWTFDAFVARDAAGDPPISPLAAARPELPPEPRLEVSPRIEIEALRASEDEVLRSYGWVDEKGGVARIPIDRAVDLILDRGLPARKKP
jgi:hypothetical protein